jgi:hypothetical protein
MNIHECGTENAVEYDGISNRIFGGDDIKEEPQWIEHGRLDIRDERGPGEHVGIPEWKRMIGPHVVIQKLFPRVKLEHNIGTVKSAS